MNRLPQDKAMSTEEPECSSDSRESASYVDGYHGGHLYGVPIGSWRDLKQAILRHPKWALVFDLEPDSWFLGVQEDPESLSLLIKWLSEEPERFEIVNQAYGHPYHWLFDVEWTIRHFLQGEQLLRQVIPDLDIQFWAPQEPMWTTSLPAVLKSFGYRGAVLKDPGTAFAGLSRGIDSSFVRWVGPDGTRIDAVPRYACEETRRTWETEARYLYLSFLEKCQGAGIRFPVGTGLQDIGWKARPAFPFRDTDIDPAAVNYTTWRGYFTKASDVQHVSHRYTLDDFQVGLPWGDAWLDRVARASRLSEAALRQAEHATLFRVCREPSDHLSHLEQIVLRSQHHDNWICARWRHGDANFCQKTERETWQVRTECKSHVRSCLQDWARQKSEQGAGLAVVASNPLGHARQRLLTLDLPVDTPDESVYLEDEQGHALPAQIHRQRTDFGFSHELNNHHVRLTSVANLPPCGLSAFKVRKGELSEGAVGALKCDCRDGKVFVSGPSLGELVLDEQRGGGICSWKSASDSAEKVPSGRVWGAFQGIVDGRELDTASLPARLKVIEQGELLVRIESLIETPAFTLRTEWRMSKCAPWVSLEVTLSPCVFPDSMKDPSQMLDDKLDVNPGQGLAVGLPDGEKDVRVLFAESPTWFDNTSKLRLALPLGGNPLRVFREGPGDVGEARLLRQGVRKWQDLQSETCIRWVDFMHDDGSGVAVFTDRHTAFVHTEGFDPAVVFAWAGEPFLISEPYTRTFAIFPHQGDWNSANLWNRSREWQDEIVNGCELVNGAAAVESLVELGSQAWELTSCRQVGSSLELRVYNSSPEAFHGEIVFPKPPASVSVVTPRGEPINAASINGSLQGGVYRLRLAGHGWATLHVSWA